MKAIELIRWALQMTEAGTLALVEGVRHVPLTQPTPQLERGGNHPLWIMGHLAYIEGGLPRIVFGDEGEPNPVEHWAELFAPGTEPKADASMYPPFDEVVGAFRRVRERTLSLLDDIGEEGLGRAPKAVPAGFEEAMNTVGTALLLICLHQMVHYGQITDARRVAGLRPLL